MTSLYNCKHFGDQYRITKFDSSFNVEASYLCDLHSCECPAGHRPHCRHRGMLPKFIQRGHVGDEWFFDHDRGGWVQGWREAPDPEEGQQDEYLQGIVNRDEAITQEEIREGIELLDSLEPVRPTQLPEQVLDRAMGADLNSWDNLEKAGLGQASEPEASTSEIIFQPQYNDVPIREVGNLRDALLPKPTIRRRV